MHENRTEYPAKKARMYQELQQVPKEYPVIGLVRMEKVRASQILPLRKALRDDVKFFSIKDTIARLVLSGSEVPGIKDLVKEIKGQCMLLFTSISPFKLNVLLGKNRIMMAARGGDIAGIDIVVPAKNTGMPPGPMLTEFKEAGIPTKIDQGTIWILKETTPVKKGEPIPEKLAGLLGKLDIKPVEAVILLESALEEGLLYNKSDLIVDVEGTRSEFARCHQEAVTLSIEAGFVTAENVSNILARAARSARAVSTESGFITDETADSVLQKAHAGARGLAAAAKGYTPA